ncbi:hypothetical protein K9L27_04680 [Candidatus Gracilibacteria bacterium]|nr:hypothetical protein [Candidatus Gracilibacteria bacterium]
MEIITSDAPTIKALHKDLQKWQKSNMWMTGVMLFLTLVMTFTVATQVYLQLAQDSGQAGMTETINP